MSGITTHVLDTSRGEPASGMEVRLEREAPEDYAAAWFHCATASTDGEGRCRSLLEQGKVVTGKYRLIFATGAHFASQGTATLYPEILITFQVTEDGASYHIPLLVSPFGYSTYRGC